MLLHELELLLLRSLAFDQLADITEPVSAVADGNLTGLVDHLGCMALDHYRPNENWGL